VEDSLIDEFALHCWEDDGGPALLDDASGDELPHLTSKPTADARHSNDPSLGGWVAPGPGADLQKQNSLP